MYLSNTWKNLQRLSVLAIYWWQRSKISTIHAIWSWSNRKSVDAENKMIELAKKHGW